MEFFLSNVSYKHALVFKDFSVDLLMHGLYDCICISSKRLRLSFDPDNINDNKSDPRAHVHTMETKIIHH
jgi:hypothetical protein